MVMNHGSPEASPNEMNMNMNMNTTVTTQTMMRGYFSPWIEWKVTLLFSSWEVTQQWQFVLTWFTVCFAVVVYHLLDCLTLCLKKSMMQYPFPNHCSEKPKGWSVIKTIFSALEAIKYSLSLLLMLTAMTYNSALFLALFIGYFIGEYAFCELHMGLYSSMSTKSEHWTDKYMAVAVSTVLCTTSSDATTTYVEDANDADETNEPGNVRNPVKSILLEAFYFSLWLMPRLLSMIFLVVLLVWVVQTQGGLGYNELNVFGYHAFFMSLFVVTFTNEAILTYAAPLLPQLTNDRSYLRYFHVSCHVLGLTCLIIGMVAIVDYKAWSDVPVVFPFYTMYSAHSWLGVLTIAFWGIQALYSIVVFYVMKWTPESANIKGKFVNFHHFLGHCTYAFGLATCALGFQDMQSSDLASSTPPGAMNMTMSMMEGYLPDSTFSQLSGAGTVLLATLGMSTFAALNFIPRPAIKTLGVTLLPSR